jgi:hypothetical protein
MPVKRAEVETREHLSRRNESRLARLSDVHGAVTAGFGLADAVSYSVDAWRRSRGRMG